MSDITTIEPHITHIAQKIREGKPPSEISLTIVHWTREAWRHDHLRPDAETIKAAYPLDFQ